MSDWPIPHIRTKWWNFWSSVTLTAVGATSKFWLKFLSSYKVHNKKAIFDLVDNREPGRALLTVTNHDSCLDDPVVLSGIFPLRYFWQRKMRWSLGAKEICFSTPRHAKFFSYGQVMPIIRGAGVYQEAMAHAIEELNKGSWLHIFPEGRVNENNEIIRYKWGVGRLVAESDLTPIVLPLYHFGMDMLLPNKEPYRPKIGQKVSVYVGSPIILDDFVKKLKEDRLSAMEIRKAITDKIQDEMYKLKAIAEKFHQNHLANKL